jgi:LacI family transcriptional regulator
MTLEGKRITLITIYDVAKKANVSAMTVSRVINKSPLIKEGTRVKVEQAIKELDYIPNRSARSLISKDTKLLSLIITDITNPFFTKIARGAEDQADKMGYQVVFSNSDEKIEKESAYIRSSVSRNMDGILFAASGDASAANIGLLNRHRIPFVLIDREIEGIQADLIIGDNRQSMECLMNHLYENGHKHIALLTGPHDVSNSRERESIYIQSLKRKGIALDERWIQRSDLREIHTDGMIQLLLDLPESVRPTAIVATNNFLAVNAIQSLRKRNIHLPEEMSIVCFDDPSPIDYDLFLTVVSQPAYEMGSTGMKLLIERIEGTRKGSLQKIILPSEFIGRKSVFKLNP